MSDELAKQTRADLDDYARSLGVTDPESLANKDEVIAAIEKAQAPAGDAQEPSPAPEEPPISDADLVAKAEAAQHEPEADAGERRPLERRESTGEWKCPFCPGPGGSMESKETRCPACGATIDGDEVVAC